MDGQGLSEAQITGLAIPLAHMADEILAYFQEPANEQAFQEWCMKKYGDRKEGVKWEPC